MAAGRSGAFPGPMPLIPKPRHRFHGTERVENPKIAGYPSQPHLSFPFEAACRTTPI